MTVSETRSGYLSGMSMRLKARLLGWSVYWALAIWLVTAGSLIGIAMLGLPILWMGAKAWVLDSFLELESDETGLLDYTLSYIWNASVYVRSFFMITILSVALGGLGWLGTADLRAKAAEPTLAEKISDTAVSVADATKETTQSWISSVTEWFSGEDDAPAD